jgi:hypothetical protein
MNKLGFLALAAQAAPRIFQVRRRTWVLLSLGIVFLLGLLIWTIIALTGWFFSQVQNWNAAAPEAREILAEIVPIIKSGERPQRDVIGTDIAPVARYPGLTRTFWHREGRLITVHFEGRTDYAAVLDHYVRGFTALGYTQELQSATPEAETRIWIKGNQRYLAKIVSEPKGMVSVDIETTLQ